MSPKGPHDADSSTKRTTTGGSDRHDGTPARPRIENLRLLEPDAWVLWQPVEDTYNMEKDEKKNWGSIFVDFDCDANGNSLRRLADGDADPSCTVETNAKYNTLRNFTHDIRLGDRLIGSGNNDSTAALSADGTGTNIVYADSGDWPVRVTVDLKNVSDIARGAPLTPVTTTEPPASDPTRNGLIRGDGVNADEDGRSVLQDGGVMTARDDTHVVGDEGVRVGGVDRARCGRVLVPRLGNLDAVLLDDVGAVEHRHGTGALREGAVFDLGDVGRTRAGLDRVLHLRVVVAARSDVFELDGDLRAAARAGGRGRR